MSESNSSTNTPQSSISVEIAIADSGDAAVNLDSSSGYMGGDEAGFTSTEEQSGGTKQHRSERSDKSTAADKKQMEEADKASAMNDAIADELHEVRDGELEEEVGDTDDQDETEEEDAGNQEQQQDNDSDRESNNQVEIEAEDYGEVTSNLKRRRIYAYGGDM